MKAKQKRHSVKQRPRPKHKPRRRVVEPKSQALTVFRRGQLMEPTRDEVALIRSLCAKDANNEEFTVFMRVAKSTRLDPFQKQIYCLIFNKNEAQKRQMVILTGIGGYRTIAARDYPHEYAGCGKPEFTFTSGRKTPAGRPIPDTCTIEIKCKDGISTWSFLYWDEIVPKGDMRTDERLKFWNNSPCNQLEKCTEAKGLRKRFSNLNGIYVDAELDRARSEETPGGRRFTIGGVRGDGSVVDPGGKLDENAAHGHLPGSTQAQNAEAQLRKVEEADRKLAEGKTIDVTPEKPKRKKKEPDNPELGKVWPKGETKPPKDKPPKKRKTMAELHGEFFNGTLHKVLAGTAQTGAPFLNVQINRIHFKCYRKSIFEPLEHAGEGSVIECYVKDGQIIGLKRINDHHFSEDGVTPVGREPGDEGL